MTGEKTRNYIFPDAQSFSSTFLRPKIYCFLKKFAANYFTIIALLSADKFSNEQQILELILPSSFFFFWLKEVNFFVSWFIYTTRNIKSSHLSVYQNIHLSVISFPHIQPQITNINSGLLARFKIFYWVSQKIFFEVHLVRKILKKYQDFEIFELQRFFNLDFLASFTF